MTGDVFAATARVLDAFADGRARVQVLDRSARTLIAEPALPYRYAAERGDLLMVLGRGDRCWITAVLHGRGESQLAWRGATTLRSVQAMTLASDTGVRLHAPAIRIGARELDTAAGTIVQRLGEQHSTMNTLDERAAESSRIVDGCDHKIAGRHETIAAGVLRIDGALLLIG